MSVNLNDNDQARILGSTIAVSVLADIAIILRFVSRKIKGSYAIDDLLAVIGLVRIDSLVILAPCPQLTWL